MQETTQIADLIPIHKKDDADLIPIHKKDKDKFADLIPIHKKDDARDNTNC